MNAADAGQRNPHPILGMESLGFEGLLTGWISGVG
jgi:hypothetical protein